MNELWMHIMIAAIAGLPALLIAVGTLLKILQNSKSITEVHLSLNSRLDQLLKITATAAHAEGVKAERERLKS